MVRDMCTRRWKDVIRLGAFRMAATLHTVDDQNDPERDLQKTTEDDEGDSCVEHVVGINIIKVVAVVN